MTDREQRIRELRDALRHGVKFALLSHDESESGVAWLIHQVAWLLDQLAERDRELAEWKNLWADTCAKLGDRDKLVGELAEAADELAEMVPEKQWIGVCDRIDSLLLQPAVQEALKVRQGNENQKAKS